MTNSFVEFSQLDVTVFEALRIQNERAGDFGLVEEMITDFKIQAPLQFLRIAKSIHQKNAALIKKEIQALKLSSLKLGAIGLCAFCEALEENAEYGFSAKDCHMLLDEIEIVLGLTIANLNAFCPNCKVS